MTLPIVWDPTAAPDHQCSTAALLALQRRGTFISSPHSIVGSTNHNRRRRRYLVWRETDAFMVPGTELKQVFRICAIAPAAQPVAHSQCPFTLAAGQRDSLRGAGPWSQHISLMHRQICGQFLTHSVWPWPWPTKAGYSQRDRHHDSPRFSVPCHAALQICKTATLELYICFEFE